MSFPAQSRGISGVYPAMLLKHIDCRQGLHGIEQEESFDNISGCRFKTGMTRERNLIVTSVGPLVLGFHDDFYHLAHRAVAAVIV